jgi:hypothetical protein
MAISKKTPETDETHPVSSPPVEAGYRLDLLNPQPGEIWVAWVDEEPVAYGKTLKEARAKAREIRPGSEPVMDLIAWLWDVGFFDDPDAEGGKRPRAVWI